MKDKVIAAMEEEVALLARSDGSQMQTHIYTIEKLLEILKSENRTRENINSHETIKSAEKTEHKADSIFDF